MVSILQVDRNTLVQKEQYILLSQKHIIKSVIWLLPLDKSVLLVTFYSLQELDECGVKKTGLRMRESKP